MTDLIVTPLVGNIHQLLNRNDDCGKWYWKMENQQLWNCFKTRGVISQMEHRREEILNHKGVVSISTGNYGFALGQYCSAAKVPCTILVPPDISESKFQRLKSTSVIVKRTPIADMSNEIEALQNDGNLFMRIDDPYAMMAYGTIVKEIIDQLGFAPDIILVPVGSGSLLAGISRAIKELHLQTIVIGLEPDYCPMMYRSFQVGRLSVDHAAYLGVLGAKYMCGQSFPICYQNGATILQISTECIMKAKKQLDSIGITVDPLAAQVMAVMQNDMLQFDLTGKTIVSIITG